MKKTLLILITTLLITNSCAEKAENPKKTALELYTDSLFQVSIDSSQIAGGAILVFQNGKTLIKKSYGYASLELSAPIPEDGIFEIGSVTKQFTAAAILKLVEANKLSLEDDFTKYLKFDTKGRNVTIDNLLNHTSGIPSYTAFDEFETLSIQELPRDSLVRLIETKEFMFEPDEALIYNNSAYFFLGLIIEKITGQTYEAYLKEMFFSPLGMNATSYSSNTKITKNKVYGYNYTPDGLQQKEYLNHIWPYAGGSLSSNTKDLRTWITALHQGKILSDPLYQSLITPGKLKDGSDVQYAKALVNYSDFGNRTIGHGGGINGFLTETRYFPDEDLYIICLINTTGPKGADFFADKITWKLLDKKITQGIELDIDTKPLEGKYTGATRGSYSYSVEVKSILNGLTTQSMGSKRLDTLKTYIGDNTCCKQFEKNSLLNQKHR
ncbi:MULTISPECIES: serine hydrolase domain-containing protein [unclassified Polaribacter]|uniref:serine hydrolase domain-containing protein n=1 Tax=unclassified Polaribacter TaxID=196858 RepID=UPI0011BF5EED|nr:MULTISPECIES: serine hydrolase domain-containing protein [unclassified Polaribacter]TXD50463.1 beta-lactamase family protein [Polaribacter sp. IC063]TXD56885.1 beta-lactamase family protein [Polaribacter sp. IC066]